jgi:small subunit ribosomal protein S12e
MSDAGSETASNVEQVEQVEQVADNSGPMSVEDALQEVIKVSICGETLRWGVDFVIQS